MAASLDQICPLRVALLRGDALLLSGDCCSIASFSIVMFLITNLIDFFGFPMYTVLRTGTQE
jgi:hypothetical protein